MRNRVPGKKQGLGIKSTGAKRKVYPLYVVSNKRENKQPFTLLLRLASLRIFFNLYVL